MPPSPLATLLGPALGQSRGRLALGWDGLVESLRRGRLLMADSARARGMHRNGHANQNSGQLALRSAADVLGTPFVSPAGRDAAALFFLWRIRLRAILFAKEL